MAFFWAFLYVFIISILTFILHEGAHFSAAVLLGYEPIATINHVNLLPGEEYKTAAHAALVSIAGPVLTVAQGLVGALIAILSRSVIAFYAALVAFFHRATAAAVSFTSANDEMRVANFLELWPWTLFAVTVGIGLIAAVMAAKAVKPGWARFTGAWVGFSTATTLVVLGESLFPTIGG